MTSEFDTPTGDPVQVARDGVAEARAKLHDVVIVDTAGRLGVDAELMQQARNIRDAIEPQEVLFVIDAMIGQDAVNTANAFNEGVDFTGVVLSKLDGAPAVVRPFPLLRLPANLLCSHPRVRTWMISSSSTPTVWPAAFWIWAMCSL